MHGLEERLDLLDLEAREGHAQVVLRGRNQAGLVRVELSFSAHASPTETALMEAIRRVAAKSSPAGVVVPRVIAGFTDAHWFRAQGIVAYGFVPRRLRPVETRGVHGVNERISIENLALGVESTLAVLRELDVVEGASPVRSASE